MSELGPYARSLNLTDAKLKGWSEGNRSARVVVEYDEDDETVFVGTIDVECFDNEAVIRAVVEGLRKLAGRLEVEWL